jgi:nucleotide-binding universal stress UspA family protein
MEKRILIPTDFSKNALNAIEYALDLYESKKCIFYFLNVFQVNTYYVDDIAIEAMPEDKEYENAKKVSEDGLAELLATVQRSKKNTKFTYQTISTYNTLAYAVEDIIAKKDIEIVIMGTKGATGIDTALFGTNTSNVMEHISDCPFLVIPENYKFSRPKEIVFPSNYKSIFKRKELEYMLEIAKKHHSNIAVLHIEREKKLDEEQENNKALLTSILQNVKHSFHSLTDIKVEQGINTFIQSRKSDMVVLVNKKSHFFGKKLSKPLRKEIGKHSIIPVLVLFTSN